MKKINYQIEFTYPGNKGRKSFEYFFSTKEPWNKAIEVANAFIEKKSKEQPMYSFLPHTPYKPPKKVLVRQYDNVKKCAVKGGKRFILRLSAFTAKTNLRTIKQVWYEYDNPAA